VLNFFIEDGEEGTNKVKKKMSSNMFKLVVEVPTLLEEGDTLEAKGKLTYVGSEKVTLEHGSSPMVKFALYDSEGQKIDNKNYAGVGLETEISPNHTFESKDKYKLKEKGIYRLKVYSGGLFMYGEPVYHENVKGGHIENSVMVMEPIEIVVED
jgi:hypothetical protein